MTLRTRLATLMIAAALLGCDSRNKPDPAEKPPEPEPPKPVEVRIARDAIDANHIEVAPVEKRPMTPRFPAAARVAFNAEAMAHVGASVPGRVAELKVHLGDPVKKGDELLIVESPDLGEAQSDYIQKRTAVTAAQAAVEPARIAYERGKSLFEKSQGVALAEVQKREAEFKAASAAAASATAAATGARNKLYLMGMSPDAVHELEETGKLTPRYSIRTPIAGQLIQCDLTLGALVGPDKELQIEVADIAKVWVLADVPEADCALLARGANAFVTTTAIPGQTFAGHVTLVAAALDPATRTLQARIEVDNAAGALRPGMLAMAEIERAGASPDPVLAIPSDAVMPFEDGAIVFVPVDGPAGKYKRRDVKPGPSIGGYTAITSGLSAGERVVTHGAFILKAQLAKPPEEKD